MSKIFNCPVCDTKLLEINCNDFTVKIEITCSNCKEWYLINHKIKPVKFKYDMKLKIKGIK